MNTTRQFTSNIKALKHYSNAEKPLLDKPFPEYHRPISNVYLLSKLIENLFSNHGCRCRCRSKIHLIRYTQHIMNNKLHNSRQSAYKLNNNTDTLLFDTIQNISSNIKK